MYKDMVGRGGCAVDEPLCPAQRVVKTQSADLLGRRLDESRGGVF
jgi:hypothetical protein